MNKITCLLIDDEPLARALVREYLQAFPEIEIVGECSDGFEGVKSIAQHQPDFIFLDVQMPKISGFEMLELIESPPPVIFTTAFDAYAMKAFENHALDYLLKPFSDERFKKAIDKMKVLLAAKSPLPAYQALAEEAAAPEEELTRIVVKHQHAVQVIPLSEVNYLEAYGDYVKIHTARQVYLKKHTMNYFDKHLDPKKFIRVHRSYLVPATQIDRIDPPDFVFLRDGQKIPVSKTGYVKLKEVLGL